MIIHHSVTDVNNSIFRFRIWLALPVTDHAGKRAHRIPPFPFREDPKTRHGRVAEIQPTAAFEE